MQKLDNFKCCRAWDEAMGALIYCRWACKFVNSFEEQVGNIWERYTHIWCIYEILTQGGMHTNILGNVWKTKKNGYNLNVLQEQNWWQSCGYIGRRCISLTIKEPELHKSMWVNLTNIVLSKNKMKRQIAKGYIV